VGGALERGLSLEVTLAADLYLCPLVEKWISVADLSELKAIRGLLHNGVAVSANNSTTGMRAGEPVSLNSLLMALEAGVVLDLRGHWRIRSECDEPTHTLSSSFSHVIA